jgi:tetraacyldisaccharide 4'-kinase
MPVLQDTIDEIVSGDLSDRLVLAASLSAAAAVYGGGLRLKTAAYEHGLLATRRLPCAVISIGNLTVGGTGKTPMTVYVSRLLSAWGHRNVILSRGYGGSQSRLGGVASDGVRVRMSSTEAGDEPVMMAGMVAGTPLIVDRNRHRGGLLAVSRYNPEVALLDDGFQHLKLHRDLDLVLLDARRPLGNGNLLPRGPLREPVRSLNRADALIWTRADRAGRRERMGDIPAAVIRRVPAFACAHVPGSLRLYPRGCAGAAVPELSPRALAGRRVFAFSAIADNQGFCQTLERLGAVVIGRIGYPDHHPYGPEDIDTIYRRAASSGARHVVTTEKDQARLAGRWKALVRHQDVAVLGIRISFGHDRRRFEGFLKKRLAPLLDAIHSNGSSRG